MIIPVMYKDGSKHVVSSRILERLLAGNEILAFRRADGWAVVGRDPLRGSGDNAYSGPDKRRAQP